MFVVFVIYKVHDLPICHGCIFIQHRVCRIFDPAFYCMCFWILKENGSFCIAVFHFHIHSRTIDILRLIRIYRCCECKYHITHFIHLTCCISGL